METGKMILTELEKQELRLWCLKADKDLPLQLYNWLLKAESRDDLSLRKTCYIRSSQIGSANDKYQWVKNGIIPK